MSTAPRAGSDSHSGPARTPTSSQPLTPDLPMLRPSAGAVPMEVVVEEAAAAPMPMAMPVLEADTNTPTAVGFEAAKAALQVRDQGHGLGLRRAEACVTLPESGKKRWSQRGPLVRTHSPDKGARVAAAATKLEHA